MAGLLLEPTIPLCGVSSGFGQITITSMSISIQNYFPVSVQYFQLLQPAEPDLNAV